MFWVLIFIPTIPRLLKLQMLLWSYRFYRTIERRSCLDRGFLLFFRAMWPDREGMRATEPVFLDNGFACQVRSSWEIPGSIHNNQTWNLNITAIVNNLNNHKHIWNSYTTPGVVDDFLSKYALIIIRWGVLVNNCLWNASVLWCESRVGSLGLYLHGCVVLVKYCRPEWCCVITHSWCEFICFFFP